MEPTGYQSEWVVALEGWSMFVHLHPELAYKEGHFPFHNFLRRHANTLKRADAIRLAKNKFWIAHRTRFVDVAFECATGVMDLAPEKGDLLRMPIGEVAMRIEQTSAADGRNPTSNRSGRDQARRADEATEQR